MASAVSNVFAIPELLELILSNIQDLYQLFTVQRASRTFKSTIEGSLTLRRTMGLLQQTRTPNAHYPSPAAALLDQIHPILYPINMLDFFPYIRGFCCPWEDCPDEFFCRDPAKTAFEQLPTPGSLRDKHQDPKSYDYKHGFWLDFLLRPGLTDDGYLVNSEFRLGFTRDHDREGATHPHGSWRNVRVSLVQKPVEVSVCVLVPRSICKRNGIEGHFCYREHRRYENGEVTLGMLVDLLEDVRSRTYEEHFETWDEPEKYWIEQLHAGQFDDDNDDDEADEESSSGDGNGEPGLVEDGGDGDSVGAADENKTAQDSAGDTLPMAGLHLEETPDEDEVVGSTVAL